MGLRFEESLGLSGGEDTLFSAQLARGGGRMVWCQEAVVVDEVPPSRLTRTWVLTRAMSHGNSASIVALLLARGAAARLFVRTSAITGGVLRLAAGSARAAGGRALGSPRHQARGQRTAYRGRGMLMGALGYVYEEYTRDGRVWRRPQLAAPSAPVPAG